MDPRRRPPGQPIEDLAHCRQDEAKVVVWIERSHPAVEDLDGLGPSIDLRLQIRQDPVPELAHEVLPRRRFGVHERLRPLVVTGRPALDEITGQGERRSGESDQGNG